MVEEKIETISQEYADSIIDTVREPLIILNQDLRVVTANHSFYAVFKVNSEETIGQLIYDLGNKQWDIPKLRELLEIILPEKTTFDDYEVEHDFTDIGRRIMLLNARQIERGTGKKRIILLAIEDITERKRLEDLVAESEERYRRLFETASDGIVLLEKNKGHIVRANPAAEKMLGYTQEETIGKMLQDIGIPLDFNDFQAIMESLKKCGILNYDEVPVTTRFGKEIYTDIYMVDKAKLAQCNIRDVTERKLADNILKEEKKFIENALNTLQDIFFVFNLEGRFIRWNKTMNAVTGYCDREISLMTVTDLSRMDDRKKVAEAIQDVLNEGIINFEATCVTKDGSDIPYAFSASLLKDGDGNPIGIIGIGRDITESKKSDAENKKLEALLRHAQKMEAVGTLAGGIAHDFNNILNVIMGYGTMVMDNLQDGSPSKKNMNEVIAAAERAADLTKRLLLFSRKQVVDVKRININELVLGLQKFLVRIIRENIQFHLGLAVRDLIVVADAGQIEQVLMNLAANARDAMPEGGRLTISTGLVQVDEENIIAFAFGRHGTYVLITVADTGHGMDAETQKKIFEPFFTTKDVGEGTGLGLAISYGIIKQHGGYITVYSEPEHGTLFKIYLPLCEEAASPDMKAESTVPTRRGNETILVAEDDPALRKLAGIVLESFGYSVILAEDGEDAITKFVENRERIGLVMLDMIMPKKSGKEVAEAIRKVSPHTKLLFSSGYTRESIKSKDLTAGGFDFIHKPFRPKDLLRQVRDILDR